MSNQQPPPNWPAGMPLPQAPAPAPAGYPPPAPPAYAPPAPAGYPPPGYAPVAPAPSAPYQPQNYTQPGAYQPPAPYQSPGYAPPQGYAPSAPQSPAPLGGLLGNLANAQFQENGSYFDHRSAPGGRGDAICQIARVTYKNTQKRGAALIAVFRVIQSNDPSNPPGTERSIMYFLTDVQSFPRLLRFVAVATGLDPSDPNDKPAAEALRARAQALVEEMVGAQSVNGKPLAQVYVRVQYEGHITAKNKQEITRENLTPYRG